MTEYDVKQIIKKENDKENEGGCIFALIFVILFLALFYLVHAAGEDYTKLKERVKQLESQVEKK